MEGRGPRSGDGTLLCPAQLPGAPEPLVTHDLIGINSNDYGRETLAILDTPAAQHGLTVQHLAVPWPGLDQKATWLRVKVAQPDWVILRSTSGVMTVTALKEAAQIGIPRNKIVGVWWACSEQDTVPAGEAAIGYICASFHGT